MYRQIKTPNLDPVIYQGGRVLTGWLGYCLAYVQYAYNANWAGVSAWDAWSNRVRYKHHNRRMPKGVYVPIWFDGWWQGQRLGHVAIYKDGIIWSSPFTSNKPSADVLVSIEQVENAYGMRFIGWSEDIGGVKVITKGGSVKRIENTPNWRARFNKLHRQLVGNWNMSDKVFRSIVGHDAWSVVERWSDHPNAKKTMEYQAIGEKAVKDKWQKQIYDLQAAVKKLKARPTKAELDSLKKRINELSDSATVSKDYAKEQQAAAAKNKRELEKLMEEQEKSKKEAESFITNVINAVRGMFGGK